MMLAVGRRPYCDLRTRCGIGRGLVREENEVPAALVLGAVQNYPLLDAFLTMLFLFLYILWIFLIIRVIMDVFRSRTMSGWAKAGWVILVIIMPLIGVLAYLIFRGGKIHEHDVQDAQAANETFKTYVRQATAGASVAEQLTQLARLRDQGVLTDDELAAEKAKLLGPGSGAAATASSSPAT